MPADPTAPKQQIGRPFLPGQSGNPAGRPKGSRNKFAEAFITDLARDWEKSGSAAIEKVRTEDPSTYLRVAASIIPKELIVDKSPLGDLSDDELANLLEAVRGLIGPGKGAGERAEETVRH